jgi:hypothetical protein
MAYLLLISNWLTTNFGLYSLGILSKIIHNGVYGLSTWSCPKYTTAIDKTLSLSRGLELIERMWCVWLCSQTRLILFNRITVWLNIGANMMRSWLNVSSNIVVKGMLINQVAIHLVKSFSISKEDLVWWTCNSWCNYLLSIKRHEKPFKETCSSTKNCITCTWTSFLISKFKKLINCI